MQLKHDSHMNADQVKAFYKASLAHFKVPRYVISVDESPQTVSGKSKNSNRGANDR